MIGTLKTQIKIYDKNSFHQWNAYQPHISLNNTFRKLFVVSEMCRNVHACVSLLHRKMRMATNKSKSKKEILDRSLKQLC